MMRTTFRHISNTAVILLLGPVLMASPMTTRTQDIDITGEWVFEVDTDAGGGMPTLTLTQNGGELTGHYSSENLGEAELTGTVDGQTITFTFPASAQGVELNVTYAGTIVDDTISGTLDLGGFASGTFTGRRAE